jgi:hypothetical protein
MVGQVVVFDYTSWSLRFPELAGSVVPQLAQLYFNEAEMYCDNTAQSIITNTTQRAILLNLLTAHIAKLSASINGQPVNPLVGRINSAGEGSVNVGTDFQYPPGTVQWYQQTQYGASYWAMTAQFRTMRYAPGKRDPINPFRVPR